MNPKKCIQLDQEGKCMDFEKGKNEAYQED
jgi:hypothetical protein